MTAARHARPPAASRQSSWGVFVDELRLFATGGPASEWWVLYLVRQPGERITYLEVTPSGAHVHVACDSKDDAEWLRETIAGHGVNPKFLKVATLESCQREVARRAEREAARAIARAALAEADREFSEAWAWWVQNVLPDQFTDREASNRMLRDIGYPEPSSRTEVLRQWQAALTSEPAS